MKESFIMSKTTNVNMQDATKQTDALLDFCKHSETELDYEYAESLPESSDDGKSKFSSVKSNTSAFDIGSNLPKLADTIKPMPSPSTPIPWQRQTRTDTGSKFRLQEQINKIGKVSVTSNAFDLHPWQKSLQKPNLRSFKKTVYDAGGFNYEEAIGVDKLLEEAYTICDKCENKLDSATRGRLLKLISELEELKHLDEKEKASRVADWLNDHTTQPEPEMCGFTLQDPFRLRKFVTDVRPRISTSDTNITLGKRKRRYEDSGIDDVSSVHGSSSDRVFVHADWSRPCAFKKRRRVRE